MIKSIKVIEYMQEPEFSRWEPYTCDDTIEIQVKVSIVPHILENCATCSNATHILPYSTKPTQEPAIFLLNEGEKLKTEETSS